MATDTLVSSGTNTFATSPQVSDKVYAADYAVPTPAKMTAAISDLHTAYVDAAGRTNLAATELYAGNLSGQTLAPGIYKWSTNVQVASGTTVTLSGLKVRHYIPTVSRKAWRSIAMAV